MAVGRFWPAGACVAATLIAPVAGAAEWRAWCGPPGSDVPLGWHFYCDREEPEGEAPSSAPVPVAAEPRSALNRILEMRRELEEARAAAVLDPNPGTVAAYLHLQRGTLERAATFSDVFRRTVWATPALDYTLTRPVGTLAKQLWSDDRRAERDAVLAGLSERYGLIYLGRADCTGCRVFGPLLRAFALRHGLEVLAVSLTGEALEGWPEAVPDNGQTARLGLTGVPVPAVVLFDTGTRRAGRFRRDGRGPARRAHFRAHRKAGRP